MAAKVIAKWIKLVPALKIWSYSGLVCKIPLTCTDLRFHYFYAFTPRFDTGVTACTKNYGKSTLINVVRVDVISYDSSISKQHCAQEFESDKPGIKTRLSGQSNSHLTFSSSFTSSFTFPSLEARREC